jgi:hypothetical protein
MADICKLILEAVNDAKSPTDLLRRLDILDQTHSDALWEALEPAEYCDPRMALASYVFSFLTFMIEDKHKLVKGMDIRDAFAVVGLAKIDDGKIVVNRFRVRGYEDDFDPLKFTLALFQGGRVGSYYDPKWCDNYMELKSELEATVDI